MANVQPDAWKRWDAPKVGGQSATIHEPDNPKLPTEQEMQALRDAAFEEGYGAGRAEGIESGRAVIQEQFRLFQNLIAAVARPFDDLDRRVEEELVALAIAVVRQLVRREIRTHPEVVLASVRESLRALPASAQDIRIVLHPEDAAIVRSYFADGQQDANWRITENPGITRGGCELVTSTSQIDATLEHRLASTINAVFGGERRRDGAGQPSAADEALGDPPAEETSPREPEPA
jgi:flagellar assembly protein FliH